MCVWIERHSIPKCRGRKYELYGVTCAPARRKVTVKSSSKTDGRSVFTPKLSTEYGLFGKDGKTICAIGESATCREKSQNPGGGEHPVWGFGVREAPGTHGELG
eukprot:6476181-Amphidinium_carterae.1